ncbi:hypothetical protein TNCT_724571 [Trichonephila clavata]|uniref:Uncharacterized protein n=1 Tax=Trichonephila clavata TaxID=2740835 RepID=A0A8X6IEU6_TRICU|nr:hypothetical protein TNCT_724571 [Trichonephila clavata]
MHFKSKPKPYFLPKSFQLSRTFPKYQTPISCIAITHYLNDIHSFNPAFQHSLLPRSRLEAARTMSHAMINGKKTFGRFLINELNDGTPQSTEDAVLYKGDLSMRVFKAKTKGTVSFFRERRQGKVIALSVF